MATCSRSVRISPNRFRLLIIHGVGCPREIGAPEPYPAVTAQWCPCVPHLVWVSDFTYICFHGIFVYLAAILDLFTGEVLAAQVMTSHSAELVLRPLLAAFLRTGCIPEWFHSDQGSEYVSDEVRKILKLLEVKIFLAPKSSPWHNGSQESFFGRFKVEFGDPERFDTLDQLVEALYRKRSFCPVVSEA
jgi:transposase InsO family protein